MIYEISCYSQAIVYRKQFAFMQKLILIYNLTAKQELHKYK